MVLSRLSCSLASARKRDVQSHKEQAFICYYPKQIDPHRLVSHEFSNLCPFRTPTRLTSIKRGCGFRGVGGRGWGKDKQAWSILVIQDLRASTRLTICDVEHFHDDVLMLCFTFGMVKYTPFIISLEYCNIRYKAGQPTTRQ